MRTRALAVPALATACAAAMTLGGGVALADPPSTPAATAIVGVGSDTTQYVMDAYAAAYSKPTKQAIKLASWDAIPPAGGSTTITTKAGCAPITRPNGGSAGVAALLADTTGCIDFARTLTPKSATQSSLAFFAYARDGIAWGTPAASPAVAASNLTTAQLNQIYTCQLTNWSAANPSLPSSTIHPYLPQAGSALRKNFETEIGISDGTVGACVNQNAEQNKGTSLAGDTSALVPFSIASYIAQAKGTIPDFRGGLVLHSVNGLAPLTKAGGFNGKYDAHYLITAYNVVKLQQDNTVAAEYLAVFGPTGFICKHQSILAKYGFNKIGSACGTES